MFSLRARFFYFGIVALVAAGGLLSYAPYLPRLLQEGYPQLKWPAPGHFSEVSAGLKGRSDQLLWQSKKRISKLNPWSEKLFSQKDGKALLVFHKGKLVVEHYAKGFDAQSQFNSYSLVKSLIGALILKAVAEEKLTLTDPIGTYLTSIKDKTLAQTPLKDFLGMRSGIMFEPSASKAAFGARTKDIDGTKLNPFGAMVRLHMNGLDDVLGELSADVTLRGRYNYQNINTALLGRVLSKVYGKPLEEILQEKIWQPAASHHSGQWRRYDHDKAVTPYCCLYARPRDWALVGHYIMTNGKKTGGAFLPEKLWRLYLGMDIPAACFRGKTKYGAHIYHNILDRKGEALQGKFSYMFGSRGQTVYMMPEKDLVVVRFGEKIQLLHSTLYAAWRMVEQQQ